MTYLVTGATGAIGRHVVDLLLENGASVRALTRNPERADLPGGVELVAGDLTATDALPAKTFADVRAAFLFPAEGGIAPFVAQAAEAGVEHLVALSSLAAAEEHARDIGSASNVHHRAVEDAVTASGVEWTLLRPGTFANNLLFWSHAIRQGDVVAGPYAESAQAPIHEADVAAVAVAALTGQGHRGQTYALTGPQALTRRDQLATIGEALGRTLVYEEISPEAFAESIGQFMPAPIVEMMLDYWRDTVDAPDVVRPTVEQVAGRPALTLARWARDHVSDFGGAAA